MSRPLRKRLRTRIGLLLAVGAALAVWVAAVPSGTAAMTVGILIAAVLCLLPAFLVTSAVRNVVASLRQQRGPLGQAAAVLLLLAASVFAALAWTALWALYSGIQRESG